MTVGELVKQGLYYARTCRSLWLFGFFVAVASGGSSNGSGGGSGGADAGGAAVAGIFFMLSATGLAAIALVVLLTIAVVTVLRFIGEGALIEGIVRARKGGRLTIGEGFRAGWAHLGVLLSIGLLYFTSTLASVALLAAPCVILFRALGPMGAVLAGVPAGLIGVPWLVTLYLVQAFAMRIAVLENRRALDAIAKARLFLHGRLLHGLKVLAASFLGSLAITAVSMIVIVPVALTLVALLPVLRVLPVILLASLVLLPMLYVLGAVIGTFWSSVWTIGYVSQVES